MDGWLSLCNREGSRFRGGRAPYKAPEAESHAVAALSPAWVGAAQARQWRRTPTRTTRSRRARRRTRGARAAWASRPWAGRCRAGSPFRPAATTRVRARSEAPPLAEVAAARRTPECMALLSSRPDSAAVLAAVHTLPVCMKRRGCRRGHAHRGTAATLETRARARRRPENGLPGEAHWRAQRAAEPAGGVALAEALLCPDGAQGRSVLLQDRG